MQSTSEDDAGDIHAGRCYDCFNESDELEPLTDGTLVSVVVLGKKICLKCKLAREQDRDARTPARPLGILKPIKGTEWVDLPSITLTPRHGGGKDLIVKVRMYVPMEGENPNPDLWGDVRMCIGDNVHWVEAGVLDSTRGFSRQQLTIRAHSNTRSKLRHLFEPHMVVPEN